VLRDLLVRWAVRLVAALERLARRLGCEVVWTWHRPLARDAAGRLWALPARGVVSVGQHHFALPVPGLFLDAQTRRGVPC
jgi:hypothetical protein